MWCEIIHLNDILLSLCMVSTLGIHLYTVGQRARIGGAARAYFVVGRDVQRKYIIVVRLQFVQGCSGWVVGWVGGWGGGWGVGIE